MYFFTWIWASYWFPNFLQRPHAWEKTASWGMVQKPIEQSEYRFLYTAILIFCLRLPSIEAAHLLRHFKWVWSDMPRHAQSYPKSWVSFISRMSWAIKLVFGMWWGVQRSQNFVQSFQEGVVRHPQSDWK